MKRLRGILIAMAVLAAAVLALWAVRGRGDGAVRSALAAHVAGVEADEAGYTRLGSVLRERAWLLSAPGQPEGVALFTGLPDAAFERERVIVPADLAETLRRIRGLQWQGADQAWSGAGRRVPLAEVRELLEAALPTPAHAAAVLDLLLGESAPGVPAFADLLQAEPPGLAAIRLVRFHGARGRLLIDRGRPPFAITERSYRGLLAGFAGAGWPAGWRVLSLQAVEP